MWSIICSKEFIFFVILVSISYVSLIYSFDKKQELEKINKEIEIKTKKSYKAVSAMLTKPVYENYAPKMYRPKFNWKAFISMSSLIAATFVLMGCTRNLSQCGAQVTGLGGGQYAVLAYGPQGEQLPYEEYYTEKEAQKSAKEWKKICKILPNLI